MECKYCGKFFEGRALGGHLAHCKSQPPERLADMKAKYSITSSGRKHTETTKNLIREKRIAYLKLNPDKVPYKLNHRHKETFPEKYFKEVLPNFYPNYPIPDTLYEADFANPLTKTIIEIDGEQHYVDPKIVNHDIKRTVELEALGWKIIRIRWASFQRLKLEDKQKIINDLREYGILNFNLADFIVPPSKCKCGTIMLDKRQFSCKKCADKIRGIKSRKFNPTKEELEILVKEKPMTEIGKMFGVSDNAVKKRCIKLGVELKSMRGHWRKVETGKI